MEEFRGPPTPCDWVACAIDDECRLFPALLPNADVVEGLVAPLSSWFGGIIVDVCAKEVRVRVGGGANGLDPTPERASEDKGIFFDYLTARRGMILHARYIGAVSSERVLRYNIEEPPQRQRRDEKCGAREGPKALAGRICCKEFRKYNE